MSFLFQEEILKIEAQRKAGLGDLFIPLRTGSRSYAFASGFCRRDLIWLWQTDFISRRSKLGETLKAADTGYSGPLHNRSAIQRGQCDTVLKMAPGRWGQPGIFLSPLPREMAINKFHVKREAKGPVASDWCDRFYFPDEMRSGQDTQRG